MSDLEVFVDFLFENNEGYVYAPTAIRGQSWTQNFYQWPQQREQLLDFIRTENLEKDVYIGPALYKSKAISKENIASCTTVWLEYDGQEVDYRQVPEPTVIVDSGTIGHRHCYWRLQDETSIEAIEETNRRLTYYLRADTSGWNATQVLRPPETINHKHGNSTSLSRIQDQGNRYLLEVFDVAPAVISKPTVYVPQDLLDPAEVLKKVKNDLRLKLTREKVPVGDRSTFLMNCGYQLARASLTELEALTLLWATDNRIKKFVGRSDVLQRLGEIIAIAFARIEAETTIQGYSPLEVINHKNNLEWIIPGWLHKQGIMVVTGQPGVGKTQFSLYIGIILSQGVELLGRSVKQSQVAFLSLEMMVEELNYIFSLQSSGLTDDERQVWNQHTKVFPAVDEGTFESYEKIFEREQPQVVIIDSLSELAQDEMKELEARRLMKWLKHCRVKYNHAQIIIHHNRKPQTDNKKPNKLSDLYGSYVFAKLSETVLCLWQQEGQSSLELITLKSRFGKKENIKLFRNEHLLFELLPETVEESNDTSHFAGGIGEAAKEAFGLEFG